MNMGYPEIFNLIGMFHLGVSELMVIFLLIFSSLGQKGCRIAHSLWKGIKKIIK